MGEATENIDLPALDRECAEKVIDIWKNIAAAWERLGAPDAAKGCLRRARMIEREMLKKLEDMPHGA